MMWIIGIFYFKYLNHYKLNLEHFFNIMLTVISIYFRRPHPPKPEERKTIRRFLWEFIHAFLGRCGIGLGLANICLGVFMAHSHFIIWVTWFAYLGFVLLCNFIAEIAYNRRRLSVKKLNSDVSQAQYIVKDIVPASQLPPEMFENLRRQSQDDKE